MNDRRQIRWTPRLVLGLFVVAAGALLLLDRAGLFDAHLLSRFWPLFLVALGLTQLAQRPRTYLFGLVLVGAGAWLQLDRLGLLRFDGRVAFALALVLFGGRVLYHELTGRSPQPGGVRRTDSGRVDALAIFGQSRQVVTAESLHQCYATVIAGACELDLRQCTLAPEGAVVETFAMWGGIEILVPDGWEVLIEAIPILGGFQDFTRPTPGGPRLVVRGMALMGGVEVKYMARGER